MQAFAPGRLSTVAGPQGGDGKDDVPIIVVFSTKKTMTTTMTRMKKTMKKRSHLL